MGDALSLTGGEGGDHFEMVIARASVVPLQSIP